MKTLCLILSGIALILVGCATSTPYSENSLIRGFSETQLSDNTWTVRFNGNGYTSRESAVDFGLLRCADLCLSSGFKYFVIVDGQEDSRNSTDTTPTSSYTTGTVYGSGNFAANTQTYGGQTYNFSKPSANNTIVCFKKRPALKTLVYDAAFVRKSMREIYAWKAMTW